MFPWSEVGVTGGPGPHCLRSGQAGPCCSKSHGCLASSLSYRGSAVPFLGGSFLCKGIIRSILSFLELKVIIGEKNSE